MGEALITRRGGGEKTIKLVREVSAVATSDLTDANWTGLDTQKYIYIFKGTSYSTSNDNEYDLIFVVANGQLTYYEDHRNASFDHFTITATANKITAKGYYSNVEIHNRVLLEVQIV